MGSEVPGGEGLRLRIATAADLPALKPLQEGSMRALGVGWYSAEQVAAACRFVCVPDARLVEDGTYFVVEAPHGRLAACGGWSFRRQAYAGPATAEDGEDRLDPAADAARVRAMFVDPAFARRGLGGLILEAAERAAAAAGFRRGLLGATLSGEPLYRARGWRATGREEALLPDGTRMPVVTMEKALGPTPSE